MTGVAALNNVEAVRAPSRGKLIEIAGKVEQNLREIEKLILEGITAAGRTNASPRGSSATWRKCYHG